ncbi:MAG: hypothetical protein NTV86_18050 [Planctomycetota bacterium]|nr:hypothetical protein [Planctomycetota bacterium]
MAVLMGFFLVLAIGGLAYVGYVAFRLHIKVIRMEAERGAQETQWNENCTTLKGQIRSLVNKYNEDSKRWHDHSATLKAEVQRLSKWKDVADAEASASAMVREGQAALEQAKVEAGELVSTARQQATAIAVDSDQKAGVALAGANDTAAALVAEAKDTAKNLKAEAQALFDSASVQAAKIIEAANRKAEEVAGSAYEAMKNAALYEQTERAIRNTIEGYGDQYIIPQQSLLCHRAG